MANFDQSRLKSNSRPECCATSGARDSGGPPTAGGVRTSSPRGAVCSRLHRGLATRGSQRHRLALPGSALRSKRSSRAWRYAGGRSPRISSVILGVTNTQRALSSFQLRTPQRVTNAPFSLASLLLTYIYGRARVHGTTDQPGEDAGRPARSRRTCRPRTARTPAHAWTAQRLGPARRFSRCTCVAPHIHSVYITARRRPPRVRRLHAQAPTSRPASRRPATYDRSAQMPSVVEPVRSGDGGRMLVSE